MNLTPDSFSDGGDYATPIAVRTRAELMIAQGAKVIDVGAESTRPGAVPLDAQAEWQRIAPVLAELQACMRMHDVQWSIDTYHADTAKRALDAGFHWLNDVNGFNDAQMVRLAKERRCTLVAMHSLGVPADPKRTIPEEADAVAHLLGWARGTIARLEGEGIARERIIIDPGIGFGKTARQSMEIVKRCAELKVLNVPLFIGHSRKSFLNLLGNAPAAGRDALTLEVSAGLLRQGVDYIRVHDVAGHAALLQDAA